MFTNAISYYRLSIDTINENIAQSSLPSLQEIAKLSLSERHKLLRPLIQEMAEDVNNDPELDFFSEIEGEGLENDDD
ncbi:MAG: hypothetical protein EWV48_06185 [Microcystis aeruginosa Ma_QC_C_20070823_S13]|nr:MAG: hypothetical protein EWV48_06185 [Microcystis aeruginosa Ma_QC_C_20070823_S13]